MLEEASQVVHLVEWPDGWMVHTMDGDERALLDGTGSVVARAGQRAEIGGGMNSTDSAFVPCGPINFMPAR